MRSLLFCLILITFAFGTKWHELNEYHYGKYLQEFNKKHDSERKEIFETRLHQIKIHNQNPQYTWKQGVNQFTDMTDQELRQLLGKTKSSNHLKKRSVDIDYFGNLPHSIDWRTYGVVTPVKNQGNCGSCWAFAATEALESYYAIATGQLKTLSEQQILDCTINATNCGAGVGGGCNGGTVEAAYDRIYEMKGLASEWTYPYTSFFGEGHSCNLTKTEPSGDRVNINNYVQLPENDYEALLSHVAYYGPPAVSVDATNWFMYESGVFNGCNQSHPDVNHAVILAGFNTDPKLGDYWLVRNSWGPEWGENGYIRLHRSSKTECGIDTTPENGNGCPGDAPVKVCGVCGILSDSVYPVVVE